MKTCKNISIFSLILALFFMVSGFMLPKTVMADYCLIGNLIDTKITEPEACEAAGGILGLGDPQTQPASTANSAGKCSPLNIGACFNPLTWVREALAGMVNIILGFVALLTGLAAVVLNGVVYYTVVDVANNYEKLTVISEAWKVVRDVANMGFIFVLLYAAIQTILGMGKDNKQLIVRIIIVAILINFSLFFTKVIIDASNVLALFFYDAIAPGAAQAGFTGSNSKGISNAFMQQLNLQGLYKAASEGAIGVETIITTGIMGTIVMLIAAFIFFAVAILFIIRYVVLIMVLILSPIVFVAYILPSGTGMDKYKNDWREALVGQAFFAPIYFLLTWITIKILGGITSTKIFKASGPISDVSSLGVNNAGVVTGVDAGFFGTFINFAVVIIFLIVSLITAKSWAAKAGPQVGNLTKWAMGAAGGVTMGMAGRLGRQTIGRVGAALGENERLKERAAKGGFVGGLLARPTLAVGRKAGASTFDARNAPGYKGLSNTTGVSFGGAGGKGGYLEFRKQKAEQESKFAGSLGPSDKTKAKVAEALNQREIAYRQTVRTYGENSEEAKAAKSGMEEARQTRNTVLGRNKEGVKAEQSQIDRERSNFESAKRRELVNSPAIKKEREIEEEIGKKEEELKSIKLPQLRQIEEQKLSKLKTDLVDIKKQADEVRKEVEEEIQKAVGTYEARKNSVVEIKSASDRRKENFATSVEKSRWVKYLRGGYNYAAAAKIRSGKPAKDEAVEILKKLQDSGDLPAAEAPAPAPSPAETPPSTT